jgi:hypothetical protein
MPGPLHQNHVQIDRIHGCAVCEEMGERLSVVLRSQSIELPTRLLALIEELAKIEPGEVLSEVRRDRTRLSHTTSSKS